MGFKRTCKRYATVSTKRGREKRCKEFVERAGKPPCSIAKKNQRSPGLVRGTFQRPHPCSR